MACIHLHTTMLEKLSQRPNRWGDLRINQVKDKKSLFRRKIRSIKAVKGAAFVSNEKPSSYKSF